MKKILVVLLFAASAHADTLIKDEGVKIGPVNEFNCVGGGITCTRSGATGVISIATGAGIGTCPAGKFLNGVGICEYPAANFITGTLTKAQISTSGTWLATDIPNLDASKITTGNFATARMPTSPYVTSSSLDNTNGFGVTVAAETWLTTALGYVTSGTSAATLPFDTVKLDLNNGGVGFTSSSSQYNAPYRGAYKLDASLTGTASAAGTKLTLELVWGSTVISKVEHTFTATTSQTVNISGMANVTSTGSNMFVRVTCETVGQTVTFLSSRNSFTIARMGIQ